MADTAADYRARAAADLAEAQQLVLPHARDRMLHSADRYLDILPRGTQKGSTLTALVDALALEPSRVLVAGDTLNDLSMYGEGFPGVCVGESEPALEDYRNRAIRLLCVAGLSGFPQISMPLAQRDGAPLGISLLGPAGSDRALVALAERIAA